MTFVRNLRKVVLSCRIITICYIDFCETAGLAPVWSPEIPWGRTQGGSKIGMPALSPVPALLQVEPPLLSRAVGPDGESPAGTELEPST